MSPATSAGSLARDHAARCRVLGRVHSYAMSATCVLASLGARDPGSGNVTGHITDLSLADALLELQELTERLRRDCPWDREQTARTIVPHTVEEAYEVADAALAGDDAKLLDEVGDLLFQTYFLALLLEERGAGDLEAVARGVHAKLVAPPPARLRRGRGETAGRVRETGSGSSARRRAARASSTTSPRALPALLYARKVQLRARAVGFEYPDLAGALADLDDELRELRDELPRPTRRRDRADPRVAAELGDVLFARSTSRAG